MKSASIGRLLTERMAPSAPIATWPMEPSMRKPKQQHKPLNDLSRSLTPFDPNQTLIAVVDNASTYCAPFYVIRTPGFFGRDLMLAHGAVQSSTDLEQQELTI